jgi:hypothetical protein
MQDWQCAVSWFDDVQRVLHVTYRTAGPSPILRHEFSRLAANVSVMPKMAIDSRESLNHDASDLASRSIQPKSGSWHVQFGGTENERFEITMTYSPTSVHPRSTRRFAEFAVVLLKPSARGHVARCARTPDGPGEHARPRRENL